MHVGQGQVPPHVPQVAVVGEQFPDRLLSLATVGALKVAVLDERDQGLGRAAHVIAPRIDRHR